MLALSITLSTPLSEAQWEFVISHFEPDAVELLGDYELTGTAFRDYICDIPPDCERVFMTPHNAVNVKGIVPLSEFKHPERACYIFGSDNRHTEQMRADHYVYVPTVGHQEMFSWVAGAITIWDRLNG